MQDFQNPGIVTQRTGLVNGVPAAELVARYLDPAVGPMVLRIIALMHPDRPESYVVLNNINQTLVPISEIAQLPQTLGGIMFQNWVYN